jgi:hypothetical protein
MKIATTFAVIALALTPTWVLAQGCSRQETIGTSAASCAVGFVWDNAKSACVEQSTS